MILIDFSVNLTGEVLDFIASMTASVLSWPVAFFVVVVMFYKPLKRLIGRVKNGKVLGVEFEIGDEIEEAKEAAAESFEKAVERVLKNLQNPPPHFGTQTEPPAGVDESPTAPAVREDDESTPDSTGSTGSTGSTDSTDETISEPVDAPRPERTPTTWSAAWNTYRKLLMAKRDIEDSRSYDYSLPKTEQDGGDWSFTVLRAYQTLEEDLRALFTKVRPQSKGQSNAWLMATYLASEGYLDESFLDSLDGLRRVRNKVAHGKARPSLREAREFGKTVVQLRAVIRSQTDAVGD